MSKHISSHNKQQDTPPVTLPLRVQKFEHNVQKQKATTPFTDSTHSTEVPRRGFPTPVQIGAGALLLGAGWAVGTLALTWLAMHPVRLPLFKIGRDDDPTWENVTFPTGDGLQISGWFAPVANALGGVILCHGFPMNRVEMLPWARLLHHAGFHTLLFDFRAHGKSEGNLCSIGYHEVQDLLGATEFMSARSEMAGMSLGAYGMSMGGAVSLLAAAREPRLAAVATHGAFATLHTAIVQRGRSVLGPAGAMLSRPMAFWGRRWVDTDPRLISPCSVIGQIAPRPVLLMHGAHDRIINPADAQALYAAAQFPKELRIWPDSWHTRIASHERAPYERALIDFFRANLK